MGLFDKKKMSVKDRNEFLGTMAYDSISQAPNINSNAFNSMAKFHGVGQAIDPLKPKNIPMRASLFGRGKEIQADMDKAHDVAGVRRSMEPQSVEKLRGGYRDGLSQIRKSLGIFGGGR